jgi:hypothetical protein
MLLVRTELPVPSIHAQYLFVKVGIFPTFIYFITEYTIVLYRLIVTFSKTKMGISLKH